MRQAEVVARIAAAQATLTWHPLAHGLEVLAQPLSIDGVFVAVSARTASACAAALARADWIVSLTTPAIEDLIYERATVRPEPVLLRSVRFDITSADAMRVHSAQLLARIGRVPVGALVACGKSWVLTNDLLAHPGRAGSYGLFSPTAPYLSATGAHHVWQPLSFAYHLDQWDYGQLLRLVRRRPGVALPAHDAPLRVCELVRTVTPAARGSLRVDRRGRY